MPKFLPAEHIVAHTLVKEYKEKGKKVPKALAAAAELRGRESQKMIRSIKEAIDSLPDSIKKSTCFILRGSIARMEYAPDSHPDLKHDIDLIIVSDKRTDEQKVRDAFSEKFPNHMVEPIFFAGGPLGVAITGELKGGRREVTFQDKQATMEEHAYDLLASEKFFGMLVSFLPYKVLHDPKDFSTRFEKVVRKAREDNVMTLIGQSRSTIEDLLYDITHHLKIRVANTNPDKYSRFNKGFWEDEEHEKAKNEVHKFYIEKTLKQTLDSLVKQGKVEEKKDYVRGGGTSRSGYKVHPDHITAVAKLLEQERMDHEVREHIG